MIKRFRLLPLSIVIMSMVLGVKIVDFSFVMDAALAQPEEHKQADKSEAPDSAPDSATAHDASETSDPHESNVEGVEGDNAVAHSQTSLQMGGIPTRKEIEYLQKLGQRREELERRSRELDDREKLLEAVEMRITERTESLKKIEETIELALKKHDDIETAQVESLVKIYSAMKAKDAANIFNNLDEDVLVAIVEKMKEKQMGAILAKMDIDKAKKLTITLITRKQMPEIEG